VEAPPHPDLLPLKGEKERERSAKERIRNLHTSLVRSLGILATFFLACAPLRAQPAPDYPNRTIRIVVPSPPGGPPDQIARMIATKLADAFNRSVIVENRAGAGGMVGTAHVAKSAADGYTVLLTTASHTLIPAFAPDTPYDAVKDFTAVTELAENYGQVLLVRPALPAKTVPELVALARAQPGKLSYGQAGLGTASHIPAIAMLAAADIDMLEVPYKGTSAAMTDLLGGRIDMFFIGPQIGLPFVQDGRLRALALTGTARWKGMPDVPTMQESGFPGFNVVNWFGVWLPAATPPAIVARLHDEIVRALHAPDIAQAFDALGLRAVGSSPADFARFVAQEALAARAIARRAQERKP
jgi:tripartite-type tricarboxylate transporter receptor subunit TctC